VNVGSLLLLLAAASPDCFLRVLANSFASVTIIETDKLPET